MSNLKATARAKKEAVRAESLFGVPAEKVLSESRQWSRDGKVRLEDVEGWYAVNTPARGVELNAGR